MGTRMIKSTAPLVFSGRALQPASSTRKGSWLLPPPFYADFELSPYFMPPSLSQVHVGHLDLRYRRGGPGWPRNDHGWVGRRRRGEVLDHTEQLG